MKVFLSAFLLSLTLNLSGQFTATLTNTVNGTSRTFKVFSKLDKYRYEFEEGGMKGIVIANPGENQMWLLLPDEKFIYKTTRDNFRMASNDPVAAIKIYASYGEAKKVGKETVSGFDCEITEYYQGDSKVFTAWFAPELNFIIKATNHMAENSFMALTDIKKWETDPALFEVPDGYTEVDERMRPKLPEPETPVTWTPVKLELPINKTFERGTKLHFVVNHEAYTEVIFTNESDTPSKAIHYQSVNGVSLPEKEIAPVSYRTLRLFPGESKTQTFRLKVGQEFTIEVHEGRMKIEVAPEK